MNISVSPKQIYKSLILIVFLLSIFSVVGQIYKYTIGHDRYLVRLFDLDQEWNIPTLYSVFLLSLASLLLFTVSRSTKLKKISNYKYWSCLSFIFFLLSCDELLSFHNMAIAPIRDAFNLSGIFYFAWVIPGGFLTLIISIIFFRFTFGLPKYVRNCFVLSAVIYIGGAIGMECLGGFYISNYSQHNLTYALITNIEELLEMLGVTTFIYSILYYLQIVDNELYLNLIKA